MMTAQTAQLLAEIPSVFLSSLEKIYKKKKSRLGDEKNWATLQLSEKALPRKTIPFFHSSGFRYHVLSPAVEI